MNIQGILLDTAGYDQVWFECQDDGHLMHVEGRCVDSGWVTAVLKLLGHQCLLLTEEPVKLQQL